MEIHEIKQRLSIGAVLAHYGLKANKNSRLCCPFHEDKTPSMQVYESSGTVYCFSANCKTHGRSMDVIEFILKKENVNKHEAIKKAESLLSPSTLKIQPETKQKALPAQIMSKTELVNKLFTYFKNGLKLSPQAKEYCQLRALEYDKIEVGFNGGQYHHGSRKDENLINACLAHGFLSESKSPSRTGEIMYNVFAKNTLVFGLKDVSNQVVSLYFRSILSEAPKGNQARHFYLKDRQGLYPSYPAHYVPKLILTESIIDAATLLQNTKIAHEYSVLALYGTNGLTEEHQTAIKSIKNLDEIIFFFDGDGAGREAVKKYAPMLKEMVSQAEITVVECPEGEDINSLISSHKPSVLEHLIETRQPFLFSIEEKKALEPIQEIQADNVLSSATAHRPNSLDTSNPFNLIYRTEQITYCIKGGIKGNLDSLKISVQIINNHNRADYRAKLDLYENKQIVATAQATAEKIHLNHNAIESDLGNLTALLEDYREQQQEPTNESETPKTKVSESNTRACVSFLQQENLLERFNQLLGDSGIVGEEANRLLLFVIATSYAIDLSF